MAGEQLMPLVYDELRRRADACMRRERPGHTLQPTALVHEAYLRLVDQRSADWHNRTQFLAVAAEIMRRILVDRARARLAAKRSGRWSRVVLDSALAVTQPAGVDVLDLDAALGELATLDPRKSRIAELRFFAGLTLEEIGGLLQVSGKTVERDWQAARAWLFRALSGRRSGVRPSSHDT
jgi:RNA polymerase sigma-70 factor, ECF subfamily